MTRGQIHDVAVVGAGMVGAALALDLAVRGFDVAMIESRAPAPWRAADDVDLRVVALAPSSQALLAKLDTWPAIAAARASAYARMHVWDALAPGSLTFDAADQGVSALGHIVENKLIQSVLWQAIERNGAIALHCPARVSATEWVDGGERERGQRVLVLDDGSRLAARLVVAADGGDSTLREMLGIVTDDRDYAQRAVVAHVHTERAHEATAWQRFLPHATIALLPLADGRCSIVWSLPEAEATRVLALDDASFCAELGVAFDFRLGRITATSARAAFPLRLRLAPRYVAPRFALVGDAAHVVHPLAGQGVNLGLRDAALLAEVVAAARDDQHDIASAHVLRRYERRRRSDNTLSAHAFDAIQRGFGNDSIALAAVRGLGLATVDRVAPLKRLFARHAAGV